MTPKICPAKVTPQAWLCETPRLFVHRDPLRNFKMSERDLWEEMMLGSFSSFLPKNMGLLLSNADNNPVR